MHEWGMQQKIQSLAYHSLAAQCRQSALCVHCLRMVFNRISVRFLMALVQWCSGYLSFLTHAKHENISAPVALDHCSTAVPQLVLTDDAL